MKTNTNINAGASLNGSVNSSSTLGTNTVVSTEEELAIFESNLKATDTNIEKVDMTSENQVEIEYKHKGRLFGFIPIRVKSTTKVVANSEGQVNTETRMPWWNIFVAGTGDIDTEVNQSLSSIDLS